MRSVREEMAANEWFGGDDEGDDIPSPWPRTRAEEIQERLKEIDREKWALSQADAVAPPKEVRLRALDVEAEGLRQELKDLTSPHGLR